MKPAEVTGHGVSQLTYVTPERLENREFIESVRAVRQGQAGGDDALRRDNAVPDSGSADVFGEEEEEKCGRCDNCERGLEPPHLCHFTN